MKMNGTLACILLLALALYSPCSYADVADDSPAPATAAKEEIVTEETEVTEVQTPDAAAVGEETVTQVVETVTPAPNQEAAPASEPALPGPSTDVPNPYTNVSDSEFYGLQVLASQLKAAADKGISAAQSKEHVGRYGEDNYLAMRNSFAQAAGTLDTTLRSAPVDIRKVHMTIKALKTLVLDIDDVFVYNPGYLSQLRNWNECKRVLRRIDGTVYREGGFRRVERILDSNQFIRDIGKFLNTHGFLSGVEDHLHRTNPTQPMDKLVGREGGGRRAAHVWMLPSATYNSKMTNDRSAFNEAVQQY